MIDFLKFVNSDTVRNHLQQIRYQPTALEAAWLTWQCETISLEEKCTAWREIIETLPDCPTGSRTMGLKEKYRDSTYAFLQAYITLQEKLVSAFYQTKEPAVYYAEYQILPKGERFWREYRNIQKSFPTLEACLQAVPKDEGKLFRITIYKENLNGDFLTAARFLPDHRLAFVDARPGSMYAVNMGKDKWALYTGVLYRPEPTSISMAKNLPLPFHSGDFLYNPNMPEGMFCGGVFVLSETESHDACGYFLRDDKPDTIAALYPHLIDCEYYPVDSLPESYRIFPLISKFLKRNHADLDPRAFTEFINDYHDLLLPSPNEPEDNETDTGKNGPFLSVEVAKVPEGMSPEEFINLMENDKE